MNAGLNGKPSDIHRCDLRSECRPQWGSHRLHRLRRWIPASMR